TLFAIPAGGGGLSTLHVFTGEDDGASPFGGLILSGGILYGTTYNGGVAGEGNIFEISASGLGFGTVYNFNAASDGSLPLGGVVVSGGALYGTTQDGGTFNSGMIYKVNLDGTGFSVLEDFPALDPASGTNTGGANPTASMVLFDGILYGTAQNGGDSGTGTIFAINTNGIGFAALTNFPPTDLLTGRNLDGANPASGLILSGNTLYGTTSAGGANDTGTLFQLQTSGAGFQTLANFSNQVTAGLSLSGGTLYGITPNGGANGFGSVFAINTDGSAFHILYSFAGASDGANPAGRLVVGNDTLYGTTPFGGAGGNGTVFSVKTNGGGFHVLKSFTAVDPRTGNNFDGAEPQAGVVLSNGALYGTTLFGGSAGDGTIFSVNTSNGAFTVLKSFAIVGYSNGRGTQGNPVNAGGAFAAADLILANGTLYGAAQTGGFAGDGTVFALTTPVQLTIALQGSQVILTWNDPTYLLQSAPTVNGTYATLTTATSPYTTTPSGAQQFFRLLAP
ncbi:MAG TPA: choice-of-anchor tandem repeat GloVer-containing protein, partial [Candidatus Saccharimonadales bacterium]|nr:choice-of-anchor tandem repeat GloVer-containing protein [Candidatus Saccharimonadales bacterium]